MEHNFTIRTANIGDIDQIYPLVRNSIARNKQLQSPSQVPAGFLEEFIDKAVKKGNMLVVENRDKQLEMIGEVHSYQTSGGGGSSRGALKEFSFLSRIDHTPATSETELVTWLVSEISTKHNDVFRVEINAPVRNPASVDHYKKIGISVEGNYSGRLKLKPGSFHLLLPLSWTNPSFN